MAEAPRSGSGSGEPPLNVEIDPDFEPQKRPRSCTWPLPRPESGAGKPGTNDTDVIPEEDDDEGGSTASGDSQKGGSCGSAKPLEPSSGGNSGGSGSFSQPVEVLRGPAKEGAPAAALGGSASQQLRKSSARRNAWGNYSYADLITQAIESSPEKRLTLSQIYDWMVRSVPYFKDKGDSNSSAGWKVSGDTLAPVTLTTRAHLVVLQRQHNDYRNHNNEQSNTGGEGGGEGWCRQQHGLGFWGILLVLIANKQLRMKCTKSPSTKNKLDQ